MKDNNSFDMSARDWSNFAWDGIIEGLPVPTNLIGHELGNKFNGQIYLSEEGDLWSKNRSKAEVGPDELGPDDIVEAYHDLFNDRENVERSRKVFERAIRDESVPQKQRKIVEQTLNMHYGVENYRDIVQDNHSSEDTVNYEFLLEPIADEPYVSINEENVDSLKSGEKQVGMGESAFFFLNTVNKNFDEYVVDEVEDPELNVDAYVEDGELVLDIYDNGSGASEKDVKGIFKPEFDNGTGLPTANYVIEEYGGELNLYDDEGGFGLEARFGLEDV